MEMNWLEKVISGGQSRIIWKCFAGAVYVTVSVCSTSDGGFSGYQPSVPLLSKLIRT